MNCKMPLITIIVPVYNSRDTISAALNSILCQSFSDWECFVVDGASKDNTLEIVKFFCDIDSRFGYISEEDKGIYDAFNKGWKLAKGEWIYYLGSDDTLTPDGLKRISTELDTSYAVVTGDVYLKSFDGSIREQYAKGFWGCHQGVIMQRDVIEKMGGFDEKYRIIADYDLLVRTWREGFKAKNVRVFLAYFYLGGTSQNISTQFKVLKERYRIDKENMVMKMPLLHSIKEFFLMCFFNLLRRSQKFLKNNK